MRDYLESVEYGVGDDYTYKLMNGRVYGKCCDF